MEFSKKTIKVKEKYQKKVKIIQENCELTDEEKYKLYCNLQDKIRKIIKKTDKSYEIKSNLSEISRIIAGGDDSLDKFLVFQAGSIISVLGVMGVVAASAPALIALAGVVLGAGLLSIINTAFNLKIDGEESINEQIATSAMYNSIETENVLDEIIDQLESLKGKLNIKQTQVQNEL